MFNLVCSVSAKLSLHANVYRTVHSAKRPLKEEKQLMLKTLIFQTSVSSRDFSSLQGPSAEVSPRFETTRLGKDQGV